jgi:hypothetical protein
MLCLSAWARSYFVEEVLFRVGFHHELSFAVSRGSLFFNFLRLPDWNTATARWSFHKFDSSRPGNSNLVPLEPSTVLGFGYDTRIGPAVALVTMIEIPIWAVTIPAAIPPLWVYHRQRKRRKIGFPVEPVAANSTK